MKNTGTKAVSNGSQNQRKAKGNIGKSSASDSQGLLKLFVKELKDIYWAEKALTKAMPKMIKNTTAPELTEALTTHLDITKEQIVRLEEIFYLIGEKASGLKCEAMAGLIKEAEQMMEDTEKGMVRDAGIILAGQKIEHYEIATYGTLCAFARTLGEEESVALLQETLSEEKDADEKLTEIAESFVNEEAAGDDSIAVSYPSFSRSRTGRN